METIEDKLNKIKEVKAILKRNLEKQGVEVPEGITFLDMAKLVAKIGVNTANERK